MGEALAHGLLFAMPGAAVLGDGGIVRCAAVRRRPVLVPRSLKVQLMIPGRSRALLRERVDKEVAHKKTTFRLWLLEAYFSRVALGIDSSRFINLLNPDLITCLPTRTDTTVG